MTIATYGFPCYTDSLDNLQRPHDGLPVVFLTFAERFKKKFKGHGHEVCHRVSVSVLHNLKSSDSNFERYHFHLHDQDMKLSISCYVQSLRRLQPQASDIHSSLAVARLSPLFPLLNHNPNLCVNLFWIVPA